ncbi:MAG: T9SS type A sorting domain-containing protein [Flavobacteriales bacterium]|nr:T9SS type A sorting domain-containing protein [Flavobacteriales bacterium]
MKTLIALLLFTFPIAGNAQQVDLVTPLQNNLIETSGLVLLDNRLITHNDSGGAAALYEIDSTTGNIQRTVVIQNATNVDWEDICFDDTYMYIADFGNNNGSRTNLRVYRLFISDYLNTPNDTVSAETISFNYADQTDFTSTTFSTNYDAEAIISWNDSLYIFTKNWGNMWTNIYALPKTPGNYSLPRVDSINVDGLITGAHFNQASNTIMLSAYAFTYPFVVEIGNIAGTQFSAADVVRTQIQLPSGYSYQLEGIAPISANNYYISTEESFAGSSGLFRLKMSAANTVSPSLSNTSYSVFPNPATDVIHIHAPNANTAEIYSINGKLIQSTTEKSIRVSQLNAGMYLIRLKNKAGHTIASEKVMIQ